MARWFLLLLSGCSLAITGPSPDRPRNKAPTCDTTKGLVAADAVLAATLGVVALSVAAGNNAGGAVVPALFGGVFALSAIHGNNEVDACNRENANYESEMASRALPPDEREHPMIAAQGAPGIAMQPAVSLPSASGPLPPQQLAPPQPAPPPPSPPPMPAQQPVPAPQPAPRPQQQAPRPQAPATTADADEPWAAFWKELP